jgi:hypothetical protein
VRNPSVTVVFKQNYVSYKARRENQRNSVGLYSIRVIGSLCCNDDTSNCNDYNSNNNHNFNININNNNNYNNKILRIRNIMFIVIVIIIITLVTIIMLLYDQY